MAFRGATCVELAVLPLVACAAHPQPAPPAPSARPALDTPPAVARPSGAVTVAVSPSDVLVERTAHAQHLSLDLLVSNGSEEDQEIERLAMTVRDGSGRLVERRFFDGNGSRPNIDLLGERIVKAGSRVLLFNPFFALAPDEPLDRVELVLELEGQTTHRATVLPLTLAPRVYVDHVRLVLPLHEPMLVHDGHDAASHHRRFDFLHPTLASLGFHTNFMRYAYDLCVVDGQGRQHLGDGEKDAQWVGLGAVVYAPGAGRVVAAHDGTDDNVLGGTNHFDPETLRSDPLSWYGNYVIVDHGEGEHSLLGHLQKGSVRVRVGQAVAAGDPVGKVGASGSANMPHLHYELRSGAALHVEGLPSTFHDFVRVLGSRRVDVAEGSIDTGDLVQAR